MPIHCHRRRGWNLSRKRGCGLYHTNFPSVRHSSHGMSADRPTDREILFTDEDQHIFPAMSVSSANRRSSYGSVIPFSHFLCVLVRRPFSLNEPEILTNPSFESRAPALCERRTRCQIHFRN
ncbi:hypothetical protein TNCT_647751 [Trichonephila clavata]|uniref:Uncharacterized protein n=1 Tax=Trichonephila clavata TaxID=2740835 RepID=A0A8X6F6H9_TRICU|nr:hypothetical protein TNCT_647751 [Trichonephila clavata]